MYTLQMMLHENSPYVQTFTAVSQLPQQLIKETKFVLRKDKKPPAEHNRRYNLPDVNEIFLLAFLLASEPADVVIYLKDDGVKRITDLNRAFDPLHFILLFPHGEDG